MNVAPKYPVGWAGRTVVIHQTDEHGSCRPIATVRLDASGAVRCDDEVLLRMWRLEGIVGRDANGRLYPSDGQTFLDELPFAYSGIRIRAEAVGPRHDGVVQTVS